MAAMQVRKFVCQLRGVLARRETADLTDADLWQRYVRDRDESAFETLVRRHGPMVLGVCRRILRNEQDAEDAFQATFLVLVRKAASIQSPSTIASWLHGVAYRTALEARGASARRRAVVAEMPPRTVMPEDPWAELWPVLEQELGRLREQYRAVVILCDLEGKTRKEVARQLGWAEGTVASRLARGRSLLGTRLARRGFTGALVAAALIGGTASARVHAELMGSAIQAARGRLSPRVVALTEGVLKSMLLTKVKSTLAVLLVLGIVTLGGGALISNTLATEPPKGTPPANPADLHNQVVDLQLQLQQIQKKLDRLQEQTQPTPKERTANDIFLTQFKYKIPFEIGSTETAEGGRIEIREVWGTRKTIEVGGQYLVRGKYVLPRGERGKLYFYETAEGAWNEAATLDLQTVTLDKQEGEFTVVHGMAGPGYFHLYLAAPDRYSRMFANVYFGTGDNVWRKKP